MIVNDFNKNVDLSPLFPHVAKDQFHRRLVEALQHETLDLVRLILVVFLREGDVRRMSMQSIDLFASYIFSQPTGPSTLTLIASFSPTSLPSSSQFVVSQLCKAIFALIAYLRKFGIHIIWYSQCANIKNIYIQSGSILYANLKKIRYRRLVV